MNSEHRVAIVTGGARGIGRGIATALAREGYAVAIGDLDGGGAEACARELAQEARPMLGAACDVTKETAVGAFVERVVAELGVPHVLVNNAGIACRAPLENLRPEDWDRTMAVNLRAAFICTQVVGRHMLRAGRGSIVNIASVAGLAADPGGGAYTVSKAGVIGLTILTAVEWGPRGIRCNCVSPGLTRTSLTESIFQDSEIYRRRVRAVPMRTLGRPEDIANVVAFLASDAARYVNGQNIVADGGFLHGIFDQIPGRDLLGDDGRRTDDGRRPTTDG